MRRWGAFRVWGCKSRRVKMKANSVCRVHQEVVMALALAKA